MLLPFAVLTVTAAADVDWLVTRFQVNSSVVYNSTTHTLTIGNGLIERFVEIDVGKV